MNMNWDYIAGYFDGEGHAGVYKNGEWVISFVNSDKESIIAIRDFIGAGIVCERNKENSGSLGTKTIYELKIRRAADARKVCKELLPRCIIKVAALNRVLDFIKDIRTRPARLKDLEGLQTEDIYRMYWTEEKSSIQIEAEHGLRPGTIRSYMQRNGIPARNKQQEYTVKLKQGKAKGRYSKPKILP